MHEKIHLFFLEEDLLKAESKLSKSVHLHKPTGCNALVNG